MNNYVPVEWILFPEANPHLFESVSGCFLGCSCQMPFPSAPLMAHYNNLKFSHKSHTISVNQFAYIIRVLHDLTDTH